MFHPTNERKKKKDIQRKCEINCDHRRPVIGGLSSVRIYLGDRTEWVSLPLHGALEGWEWLAWSMPAVMLRQVETTALVMTSAPLTPNLQFRAIAAICWANQSVIIAILLVIKFTLASCPWWKKRSCKISLLDKWAEGNVYASWVGLHFPN